MCKRAHSGPGSLSTGRGTEPRGTGPSSSLSVGSRSLILETDKLPQSHLSLWNYFHGIKTQSCLVQQATELGPCPRNSSGSLPGFAPAPLRIRAKHALRAEERPVARLLALGRPRGEGTGQVCSYGVELPHCSVCSSLGGRDKASSSPDAYDPYEFVECLLTPFNLWSISPDTQDSTSIYSLYCKSCEQFLSVLQVSLLRFLTTTLFLGFPGSGADSKANQEVFLSLYVNLVCLRLTTEPEGDGFCPECEKIMVAECVEAQSKAMTMLTIKQLSYLPKFAIQKMKQPGTDANQKPVPLEQHPDYMKHIFHSMDLRTLEKKAKKKTYGCTEAFLADAKWILHNCIIYNGGNHKLTQQKYPSKSILMGKPMLSRGRGRRNSLSHTPRSPKGTNSSVHTGSDVQQDAQKKSPWSHFSASEESMDFLDKSTVSPASANMGEAGTLSSGSENFLSSSVHANHDENRQNVHHWKHPES
ncbi:hypothetical protein GH733_019074 [Mirounga leonina]|nr:hypothetical protein GH733_019074 [Mirounga leonina]